MNYIKREQCVITGEKDLEPLYFLPNFPVFIGCTDQDKEQDLFADMEWSISKSSGLIQLAKLIPLDAVYSDFHSEAVGDVWKRHRDQFSDFIIKNKGSDIIVEMGGSNGALAELCLNKAGSINSWTIVEPNPDPNYNPSTLKINIQKSFIEDKLEDIDLCRVFVHSHVLEHLYSPVQTMKAVANKQNKGDLMIFSIPNLYEYLNKKYANSINFEHTYFLTEDFADFLLGKLGYRVRKKYLFEKHSIFYCAEYIGDTLNTENSLNYYDEYKALYLSMIDHYKNEVKRINLAMRDWSGDVYLFGAHVSSQFLIYMGLDLEKISGIVDNSRDKEGKRLYGSSFEVSNPIVISQKDNVMVIVKAGQYQKEVEKQLNNINKKVFIVE